MSLTGRSWLIAAFLATVGGGAQGGTVLTFEGLKNFEGVANYYNGGKGSQGTGPGPSYGVTFSSFGLAYIPGQASGKVTPYPNDPSPPTVLLLHDPSGQTPAGRPDSMTMNVSGGFMSSLSFYYIAIDIEPLVEIFSGANGTGTVLGQESFATTPQIFANGPVTIAFSGTAESVVFYAGDDQLVLDNISFQSVPEPSSWVSLLLGSAGVCLIWNRRRARGANRYSPRKGPAMCRTGKSCLVAALLISCGGPLQAGTILTFEGLQSFEQVADYYDGGTGSFGSGPGPYYGITFSSYGLAYIPSTPFAGDPSPPTVLLMFNPSNPFGPGYPISVTMNSVGGFSQALSFYDIVNSMPGSVEIFSGPNGTGTMLADRTLPLTATATFSGEITVPFSGTAYSAVFTGPDDLMALDNITFVALNVPEPSSWVPLFFGLGSSYLLFKRRRNKRSGS